MEWIDYLVRVGEDGKVDALGSLSTLRPRGTHYRKSTGKAVLELLAGDAKVLVRETVTITAPLQCHGFEPGYRLASGRVPLLEGAAGLRLVEGDTILHEQSIGPAPQVALDWPYERVERSRPMTLKLALSEPVDDALLLIALEWQRGRLFGLGARRPARSIDIDFGRAPGGAHCRLHVVYTSGLRSARAVTGPFALAPAGTDGAIVQPRPKQAFFSDETIVLAADVTPADQVANSAIKWHIEDLTVAVGRHAVLNGSVAGEHELVLVVDNDRADAVTIEVTAPIER